jgi:hypothetical protein
VTSPRPSQTAHGRLRACTPAGQLHATRTAHGRLRACTPAGQLHAARTAHPHLAMQGPEHQEQTPPHRTQSCSALTLAHGDELLDLLARALVARAVQRRHCSDVRRGGPRAGCSRGLHAPQRRLRGGDPAARRAPQLHCWRHGGLQRAPHVRRHCAFRPFACSWKMQDSPPQTRTQCEFATAAPSRPRSYSSAGVAVTIAGRDRAPHLLTQPTQVINGK